MALIKCLECGKEISDKASSCPYCGTKDTQESSGLRRDIFTIVLFFLIIFGTIDAFRGFPMTRHLVKSLPVKVILIK